MVGMCLCHFVRFLGERNNSLLGDQRNLLAIFGPLLDTMFLFGPWYLGPFVTIQ